MCAEFQPSLSAQEFKCYILILRAPSGCFILRPILRDNADYLWRGYIYFLLKAVVGFSVIGMYSAWLGLHAQYFTTIFIHTPSYKGVTLCDIKTILFGFKYTYIRVVYGPLMNYYLNL